MTRRHLEGSSVFLIALLASCATRPTATTNDGTPNASHVSTAGSAGEPAPSSPTGAWAVTDEPARQVVVVDPCFTSADVFHFSIAEGQVQLFRSLPSTPSGVPHSPPHERAAGHWKGAVLRLEGEDVPFRRHRVGGAVAPSKPVTYELRFEPETHNLVGTRNGAPIRLAPAEVRHQAPCGSPPP